MERRQDNPEFSLVIVTVWDVSQDAVGSTPPGMPATMGMIDIFCPGNFPLKDFGENYERLLANLAEAQTALDEAQKRQAEEILKVNSAQKAIRYASNAQRRCQAYTDLYKSKVALYRANKQVSKACKDWRAAQQALDEFLMG